MTKPQFADEELKRKTKELYSAAQEKEAQRQAQNLNLSYLDGRKAKIQLDAMRLIDEQIARENQLVPIYIKDEKLIIVTGKSLDKNTQEILNKLKQRHQIELYFVSTQGLLRILNYYEQIPKEQKGITGSLEISAVVLEKYIKQFTNFAVLKEKLSKLTEEKISESFEIILGGALATEASDIHVEPREQNASLRFRIDGLLQDLVSIKPRFYRLLLNRIKLLSNMKLNIQDAPQDGRFSIKALDAEIEIRSSILPGPYGENIVLRVLNPKIISLKLEQLGLAHFQEEIIQHELKKPNGMILVTGPTGSGKTTTLYALLKKVHEEPGLKIITIEDPIEYHLEGVEQTQIAPKKGYTFGSGLKSVLRQDPDIILIGEMRDLETVETALHAALTGHLVFSTLHTNDAAGTIPRLIDIGAKPPIIAPAINVAVAQRLVRKICKECVQTQKATNEELEKIKNILKKMSEIYLKKPTISDNLTLAKAQGCKACNETGYKGRIGVFEIFKIDDDVEKLILSGPTELDIKEISRKKGMVNLMEDGIIKVLNHVTTLEEFERVIGE